VWQVTSVLTVSMPDDATATEPVIEVVAEVSGVSLDDAQSGDFEDTFEHAVADMLDVPPEQVRCTACALCLFRRFCLSRAALCDTQRTSSPPSGAPTSPFDLTHSPPSLLEKHPTRWTLSP